MLRTCVSHALLLLSIWGEVSNGLSIPGLKPATNDLRPLKLLHRAAPASGTLVSQAGWTATVDSFQSNAPAVNAIDGNPNTFWHTQYSPNLAPLPHTYTIDMHATYNVNGIGYLPRQDGNSNGNIGSHQIYLSTDNVTWVLAAFGMYYDDSTQKYSSFETVPARYVQIKALSEAGNRGPWTTAAEFTVFATGSFQAPPSNNLISQNGWTATADSFQANAPAVNAIDGNPSTFWHTQYSPTLAPLPHTFTIDTHATQSIVGLGYLPRQDGVSNGNIGSYQISVSNDNVTYTLVASGSYFDDSTQKYTSFATVSARYVQIKALSEAGNRGPWTTAAEFTLFAPSTPGTLISQNGWTATVDSFQANAPGVNAIDGNPTTFWHTQYTPNLAPLPHTFTIDMHATNNVVGIGYLPRQDGNSNGNIGSYQISVSNDNVTYTLVASGSYNDDSTQKYTSFTATTARYIQIKALSEAGNRGPWTTAAEFTAYVPSTKASSPSTGKWSATIDFPLVPVAAVLLPNGKVLTWSSYTYNDYTGPLGGKTLTSVFDPVANTVSERLVTNTGHDMFCPGISLDVNGRVVVTGGNNAPDTSIYDFSSDNWLTGAQMNIGRGYQASATCEDGRIFTIGGSWNGGLGGKNGEIYDPNANTWTPLPGAIVAPMLTNDAAGIFRQDNHAWLFAWMSNNVFQAGPSKAMNWYNVAGSGTQTAAGNRAADPDSMCGTAVMYDASSGKILTLGGAPSYSNSTATSNAHIITLPLANPFNNPQVATIGNMNYPRIFATSVVLPSGQVFIAGGQTISYPFSDVGSQLTPEMWDSNTNAFTPMTPNSIPRNYHSFGLLLMDGTVLVGGGGLCGNCTTNHFDAQIYTPPYLLNADGSPAARPSIVSVSTTALKPGMTITITTDGPVIYAALMRIGSSTHTVNTDQRRIWLGLNGGTNNVYTTYIAGDYGITLPGYWMLFVLNANRTPSMAKVMQVT